MWKLEDIKIELEIVEDDEMIVTVTTPAGILHLAGRVTRMDRTLWVDGAHVQGVRPGALGRAGLNAIGRKFMEAADVDEIIIQGGVRTTGRKQGRAPRRIRFPSKN